MNAIDKLRNTVVGSGMVTEEEFNQIVEKIVEKHRILDREEKLKVLEDDSSLLASEVGESGEKRLFDDVDKATNYKLSFFEIEAKRRAEEAKEAEELKSESTKEPEASKDEETLESKVLLDCFPVIENRMSNNFDNTLRNTINAIKTEAKKAKESEETLESKVLETIDPIVYNKNLNHIKWNNKLMKDLIKNGQIEDDEKINNTIKELEEIIKNSNYKDVDPDIKLSEELEEPEASKDEETLESKVLEDCKDLVINKVEEIYDGHIEFDKLNGGQHTDYFEYLKIKYKEDGRVLKDLGIIK